MKFTVINGNKKENEPYEVYRNAFFEAIHKGSNQINKKKKDKEFLKDLVYNGVKMVVTMDAQALMQETVKQINEIGVTSIDFITSTMALLNPVELSEVFPTGKPIDNTFDMNKPIGEDYVHAYICINEENEDLGAFKERNLLIADMIEELIR